MCAIMSSVASSMPRRVMNIWCNLYVSVNLFHFALASLNFFEKVNYLGLHLCMLV